MSTETLTLALSFLGAIFAGGVAWGMLRAEVRANTAAIKRMHERFDGFVIAMIQHGAIDAEFGERLARQQTQGVANERRG